MDDKNFSRSIANEWIRVIEDPSADIREKDIYPLIRELLDRSGLHILDVGCGQGICSTQLGELQSTYVGVDPSPDLIGRANQLYANPNRTFIEGNIYALPFQNGRFDVTFSIAVWHLLGDIEKASQEVSRVLKNNGRFLMITADPYQYQLWTGRYADQKFDGPVFTGTNFTPEGAASTDTLYLYTIKEIVEQLEKAGLSITKTQVVRSFAVISGYKG